MRNGNEVYLTFKTDKATSYLLKEFAKLEGKTQPELINEICQNYTRQVIEEVTKAINEPL